ncbi:hypothetical protein DM860_008945 [Cuscuta australis]|uniref:Uncharacterized protein n=1 Tax=Cuscuta australis TaxID=267555 RepID=A0A328DCZ8_9ASTE|nr:hypothetical protein DM860_008945 [Cuscuta australis]
MEAAAQRKASDPLRLESVAATNPKSSNSKWPTNSTHRRSNSQRPAAAQIMGDLWAICDPLSRYESGFYSRLIFIRFVDFEAGFTLFILRHWSAIVTGPCVIWVQLLWVLIYDVEYLC